ncbi:phosphoribosylanthranilate isomerase [Halostella litorea]|uniref:phosphoribosylanthranilate isomerase n=1 Tax=Halostella litorea TaxID=2528831 RepID=UPI001091D384|nr:phosphoribosylanthranilate isomerase [Halostella litorea]
MTRAKVCGITREADLRAAVEAGADAVGVVCDVPVDTPREVSPERAADLVAAVPPFVTSVLVTMPDSAAAAADLAGRVGPDAVQAHGDLAPDAVADLADAVDAAVIKSVDAAKPERAADYDGVADALLVDSVDDAGGGGTGETHDWERTRAATRDLDAPLVLAGGLTPDNVADAARTVEPFAVDVASGVEAEPGRKDHDAVRAFVARATGATAERGVEP